MEGLCPSPRSQRLAQGLAHSKYSNGVTPEPGFQSTNGPFIQHGRLRPLLLSEKEEEAS